MQAASPGIPVSCLERISAREREHTLSETEFPVGADDEDDNFERERKRFMLLDFAGEDGDDYSASGSSSDLDSSDFEDDEGIESGAEGDVDGGDQESVNLEHDRVELPSEEGLDSEEGGNHEDDFGREALPKEAAFARVQPRDDGPMQDMAAPASPPPSSPHYQSLSLVLVRLANSEEEPLIRAEIPWSLIVSCGNKSVNSNPKALQMPLVTNQVDSIPPDATLLRALYPSTDDPNGARLLQGVLRMDPPLDAARALLEAFPLACLDMDGFFTASQFCHPKTSSDMYKSGESLGANESDVGEVSEVVRLVMQKTIQARRLNTIDWGMVAFLGDARISPSIAKLLLRQKPEALIDPRHGAFGVSPLERMASGFFIHGDSTAWVDKLRLALRVASFVKMERATNPSIEITLPAGFFANDDPSFHPYHELIRLLIDPDFQGYKFGKHGFVNTLKSCSAAVSDAFVRRDNDGNLPLHIALQSKCASVLGVKGERRLIRYLLNLRKSSSLESEGGKRRRLPLRLCVENGWPVHDLIIDAALSQDTALRSVDLPPLLHQVLDGPYSPRYQTNGVRELVRQTMKIMARHSSDPSVLSRYLDSKGRHVIHIALCNRIPVHDVIADALPHSLEARDLSRDGFYPFQIAAISFVAEVENRAGRVEYEDNENEHEKEALETSILFEIIRRDPLCITWSCNSTSELASRPVQKRNLDDGCLSVFRDKRRYETAATVSSCEQRR